MPLGSLSAVVPPLLNCCDGARLSAAPTPRLARTGKPKARCVVHSTGGGTAARMTPETWDRLGEHAHDYVPTEAPCPAQRDAPRT